MPAAPEAAGQCSVNPTPAKTPCYAPQRACLRCGGDHATTQTQLRFPKPTGSVFCPAETRSPKQRAAKPTNAPPPFACMPPQPQHPALALVMPRGGVAPACLHHAARYAPCPTPYIPCLPLCLPEILLSLASASSGAASAGVLLAAPCPAPNLSPVTFFPALPVLSVLCSLQTLGCIPVPHPCSHAPASRTAADAPLVAGRLLLLIC